MSQWAVYKEICCPSCVDHKPLEIFERVWNPSETNKQPHFPVMSHSVNGCFKEVTEAVVWWCSC